MGLLAHDRPLSAVKTLLLRDAENLRAIVGELAADSQSRLQLALLLSLIVHAVFLLGVNFKHPDKRLFNTSAPPMEVVLVNSRTQERPVNADAHAQANLDGGGNTDADRRAKSPLPVMKNTPPAPELAVETQRVQQLEREAQRLMTQIQSQTPNENVEAKPQPQEEKPVTPPSAAEILARSREAVQLQARISREWDSYQKRPRRRFVGARVSEIPVAQYVEEWRVKVERVGTLNYPEDARDKKIFGTLLLTVSIKSDGTLENIEINRPSGEKILDAAAARIVQLAAPFAPFPPNIRKDIDILHITRTWSFTRSDTFMSE
jgi:protein TonB